MATPSGSSARASAGKRAATTRHSRQTSLSPDVATPPRPETAGVFSCPCHRHAQQDSTDEFDPALSTLPSRGFSVTCNLPPGMAIVSTYAYYDEDVGA
jgi:hypothetical protein